jgi:hypothetical protein
MQYRYHTKKEVEEILLPEPVADWPKCKKCGSMPVKGGELVSTGGRSKLAGETMRPAPAAHGLCKYCRTKELREKKLAKLQRDFDAKAEGFEKTPIDPKAERDWTKLAEWLEEILAADFAIGKVGPEVFKKAWIAFGILDDAIEQLSQLSRAPIFST